jgi:hypothetical protein
VSALKILVQRAISPKPEVFVASEGGIQPSTLGIKSQLQRAAQSASVFIGVITQASKDREWLYFEAGAAWGLEKLYVPLLVDTNVSDLSTTIADLSATNAHSQDQVRRMLGAIATEIGAHLRDRFGPRYSSFSRSFQPSRPTRKLDESARGDRGQIAEAVALRLAGRPAEADALIARLEAEASDIEAKARIRLWFIMDTKQSNFERLEQLEKLPVVYARAPSYLLWRATWETSSETALACLHDAIDDPRSSGVVRRLATIGLAVHLYELRRNTEATTLLIASLASADRELRCDAAEIWCIQRKTDSPLLRMALASFGVCAHPSIDLLAQQVQISIDENWAPLAIYCAESADSLVKTGTTANDQGRAYANASLWSLAYDAYQRAAILGVSVARSNIAAIVGKHVVATVGIQLLDQHQGAFDAAQPASPYKVRATLEQSVHDEKERRDGLREQGELLNRLLTNFMEFAIASRHTAPRKSYIINDIFFHSAQNASDLVLTVAQPALPTTGIGATEVLVSRPVSENCRIVLHSICDYLPIWEMTFKERRHLLTLDANGDLIGFTMTDLATDDPDPWPVRFEGTTLS